MHQNNIRRAWLIRHGESVANAGERTAEASVYPLSELGYRQSRQLAQAIPHEPQLIVYSSYLRAKQTAEPTITRYSSARVECWPIQEVQYLDPALCVNTTQDERRDLSREYWERCDPEFAAPGAESFAGFIERVRATIQTLAQRTEPHAFLFSHGQFMSAAAWLLLSHPRKIDSAAMRRFYQFIHGYAVENCAVLPLYFHVTGEVSLGTLKQFESIERISITSGLAGI
jgi:broad specificity phosphatase PhoE